MDFFAEFKFVKIMMCYIWKITLRWEWNSNPHLVWRVSLKSASGYLFLLVLLGSWSGCMSFCQSLRILFVKRLFENTIQVYIYIYKCRNVLTIVASLPVFFFSCYRLYYFFICASEALWKELSKYYCGSWRVCSRNDEILLPIYHLQKPSICVSLAIKIW